MTGFLPRMRSILLRPGAEWEVIRQEQASLPILFRGYGAVIAALPPLAALAGRFLFDRGIVNAHSPVLYVVTANFLWYLVILVNILITATVITVIISAGPGWVSVRGLQLASYSYTPLFLAAVPAAAPRMEWLLYPAVLYSLYLLHLGIRSMTGVGKGQAAWQAAASFLVTGVIVGVLNGIEYMLESFVASKVFF